MIKTPIRGMRDFIPSEMVLREHILNIIEEEAIRSGFQKIETPAMEHIENLSSKDGGENETLTFKVMKRGQTLIDAKEKGEELSDSGLRYDLTVPLARYFANNQKNLMLPFKALQIGPVWRADRPQKGRFRQFLQCDMDVLGDTSILAEIDTITTTALIIERIFREANILGLTVHINDRRILLAAAKYAGFDESQYGSVLIALDKNDKIGLSGVSDELLKMGFDQSSVEKFISLFDKPIDNISAREFCNSLAVFSPEDDVVDNLETIADTVKNNLSDNCRVIFDPTLVRGMGYYTGPIFECKVSGFGSSVAGGGRYDKMIGKISGGNDVAACGFSIGFERIVTILEEANFTPKISADKTAFLVDRKVSVDQLTNILNQAAGLRQLGNIVSVATMSKNVKFQIEMMEKNGYTKFEKFYPEK